MRVVTGFAFVLLLSCIQTAPPPVAGQPPVVAPREPAPEQPVAAADGEPCDVAGDCASGICEGMGCGESQGMCAPRERMCTMDLVSYCGCDGQTFQSSSGCPKKRYASKGECGASAQPAQPRPVGAACSGAGDCASGICEGMGCGENQGVCADRKRRCTADLRPYCGCDGITFRASGTCPGRRFAKRGECEASEQTGRPAGSSCDRAEDCESGVCEGQGCGPGQGQCVARRRICTRDLRPYCGCDGKTFRASGSCPGRRFRTRSACP